ncbi:MAG: hypothetical protein AMJ69_08530 [Gammaproteobacteria bacterium SG8_47]|nr:MAG: hypothetical protein AMJ69_08530 [Gammaproteobacteria bacterium SG8_47]
MGRVMGVGIATVDIVNEVDGYPSEDSEVRALSQQQRRGGNATNTLVILSQLGHECVWAGVMADDTSAEVIRTDLARYGIDMSSVVTVAHTTSPTSYITVNRRNGSRTIVHYRDLPEMSPAQFEAIPLGNLDWLHFEGRAIEETARMLTTVRQKLPALRCSVEVEKPRPSVETLFELPDVIMLSRHYARARGFERPQACLSWVQERAPQAQLFLGWGTDGAYTLAPSGAVVHCPAQIPARVVDTIGAGDAFNAGLIDALLRGHIAEQALRDATIVAGRKCARSGFEGLDSRSDDQIR